MYGATPCRRCGSHDDSGRRRLGLPARTHTRKQRGQHVKIDSNDRTVKQMLQAGYYRVPRFQRPYSWTPANVEDFWTDTIVESPAFTSVASKSSSGGISAMYALH